MSDWEITSDGTMRAFNAPEPWKEGEEQDAFFQRLGFSHIPEARMGDEYGVNLCWYPRTSGEGHQYLAFWDDPNQWRIIYVVDFPALLRLQALVAPIVQINLTELHLVTLRETAAKAFRAWHGHDESGVCAQCDPGEFGRLQEARRKPQERKA